MLLTFGSQILVRPTIMLLVIMTKLPFTGPQDPSCLSLAAWQTRQQNGTLSAYQRIAIHLQMLLLIALHPLHDPIAMVLCVFLRALLCLHLLLLAAVSLSDYVPASPNVPSSQTSPAHPTLSSHPLSPESFPATPATPGKASSQHPPTRPNSPS